MNPSTAMMPMLLYNMTRSSSTVASVSGSATTVEKILILGVIFGIAVALSSLVFILMDKEDTAMKAVMYGMLLSFGCLLILATGSILFGDSNETSVKCQCGENCIERQLKNGGN